MAWLLFFSSFYNVSDIWSEFTDGGVIAKLIRHHLLSDWNVRWRERPLGLVDSLHLRFLHTESVRVSPPVIIIMWLPFKNKIKNKTKKTAQIIPAPKKDTKLKHKVNLQQKYSWRNKKPRRVFDVKEEHLGPCARRHRWHVLSKLTRRSRPPALIDSGTVVLLELNLALCLKQRRVTSAVPLADWSTAAASSSGDKKKVKPKGF